MKVSRAIEFPGSSTNEAAMKARQLIGNATYGPDVLSTLFEAFDMAWQEIAPAYGDDPQTIEVTRMRLANIILALARDDDKPDARKLCESALRILAHTPNG